jgi:putative redox protein
MARASARIAAARYRTDIHAGTHALVADEGAALGGMDVGPAPYELLLSALGACTAMTLKMYAERKGWPLASVEVDLAYHKADDAARIDRRLSIEGQLDEDQRARLADIAERTPVTLTLKGGVTIVTHLQPPR